MFDHNIFHIPWSVLPTSERYSDRFTLISYYSEYLYEGLRGHSDLHSPITTKDMVSLYGWYVLHTTQVWHWWLHPPHQQHWPVGDRWDWSTWGMTAGTYTTVHKKATHWPVLTENITLSTKDQWSESYREEQTQWCQGTTSHWRSYKGQGGHTSWLMAIPTRRHKTPDNTTGRDKKNCKYPMVIPYVQNLSENQQICGRL